MDKKSLSERDICKKFITPAIDSSVWDRTTQFLEEVNLTSGRVVVRGNKARRDEKTIRRADLVLYFKPGIPIAVVEAKDNNHSVRDGNHLFIPAGLRKARGHWEPDALLFQPRANDTPWLKQLRADIAEDLQEAKAATLALSNKDTL